MAISLKKRSLHHDLGPRRGPAARGALASGAFAGTGVRVSRVRRVIDGGVTAAILGLVVVVPYRASAHIESKLRGTCKVSTQASRVTVTATVENLFTQSMTNVQPSPLVQSGTGDARITVQTSPRAARSVAGGRKVDFVWSGRLYGSGLLDLSLVVTATFPDGRTEGSGIVNCPRLTVGTAGAPTATRTVAIPTRTPTRTRTVRPTRTPIAPAPTRTPLPARTATPTRRPATLTPTRAPATATGTRTATATRPPTATRTTPPTRTPIAGRATRTPIPTSTRAGRATDTPTRLIGSPTPTVRRVTGTRSPTVRPTRTLRGASPTPTPTLVPISEGLVATCSLRRNVDLVYATLLVENRTGVDLSAVSPGTLHVQPQGGAVIFDRAGPSPTSVSTLRNGRTASFQWSGRLSPGGTMGFTTTVSANGPTGIVRSGVIDCGVSGAQHSAFDPASFNGICTITRSAREDKIKVEIRNSSNETLTDIDAVFVSRRATGTAAMLDLTGPAPRILRSLPRGGRRTFEWTARFVGAGSVTVRFDGRASRATNARITSAPIECAVEVGSSDSELPDLTVDLPDLRSSVTLDTQTFTADHCAVVEGCVDGIGTRRLLRFNTAIPNLGPGDLFLGDPRGSSSFQYSACHEHYHFNSFADYRLLDDRGRVVARGHKQAFCLVDLWRPSGSRARPNPQFSHCGFQGISAGWADIYHRGLDCQWIDVTAVPAGRYVLEVVVNPTGTIREADYTNNSARVEVQIR